MKTKDAILLLVLLVMGACYVKFFTNWFVKKEIGIIPSLRPARTKGTGVLPVVFKLDGDYKLTNVKVVPLDSTNFQPETTEVWHLVAAKSNSEPTRMIVYGTPIPGMEPALKGTQPEPLDPNTIYRLDLAAGPVTGTAVFHTMPAGR